jgi:lysine-specific demethylase 3
MVAKERANKKQRSKQTKTTKKRGGRKANADMSSYAESSDDTDCEKVEKNFNVIQEETHYLDEAAIETLKKEYGVTPFVVAQFPGEAIVLPAGAPFQMKHILSCVSLSSDFVSPENVSHSFYLTRQMRYLSEKQTPAEDKIQIKNLIYHSVKNALSTIETTSPVDIKMEAKQTSSMKEQMDD